MSATNIALLRDQKNGPQVNEAPAVWLRLKSAAVLVDLSPGALKQRLYRSAPPAGIVRKWGRTLLIHRAKFLAWLEEGGRDA